MKILVSAYACSPFHGSEPGTGWGFVRILANKYDVYVITEKNEFENDICEYLKKNSELNDRLHFFYVPRIRWYFLEKIWPPSYYWTYRIWQKDVYKMAKELHYKINFDIIHQLNMTGFREPGFLWKMDVPFVWGPIGGMGRVPWNFLIKLKFFGAIKFFVYNLINSFQMRYFIRPRLAAQRAGSGLISENSESKKNIFKYWNCNSVILCAVGNPREKLSEIKIRKENEPIRIVWSGVHEPRKALNLALEAVSLLSKSIEWELHVLGKGSCTLDWKHLAEKLKIDMRCNFHGQLSREKALDVMENSHVMLITSLKDDSSTVAVEALGLGLPIVCLDHCGFADVVTDECGIKIPVTMPKKSIEGIALAIENLAKDESFRESLAKGSLNLSKKYSWFEKASILDEVYRTRLSK